MQQLGAAAPGIPEGACEGEWSRRALPPPRGCTEALGAPLSASSWTIGPPSPAWSAPAPTFKT